MKLKLPILMLAAIFAIQAQADSPYITTERIEIAAGNTETTSQNSTLASTLNSATFDGSTNATPKVIVKDGQGELVIDTDATMNNPFVVREGTTTIQNATVENKNPLNSYVSNLVVGGNNAHLQLDNATYTQSIANSGNYSSAMTIGSKDGSGSVTLTNNSTLHTDHTIFAGHTQNSGYHPNTTTSPTESNLYSGGTTERNTINVDNSTLSAGTMLYLGDVDVNISNNGQVTDHTRQIPNYAYGSYFGTCANSTTNVNVTDGGQLNINNGLQTGTGANSETNINISGTDSAANIKGDAWLGIGTYDWGAGAWQSGNTATNINVTDGAKLNADGTLGVAYMDKATITVDEKSSINATSGSAAVVIYEKGEVNNAGTINVDTWVEGGTLNTEDGSTMSSVYVNSGSMNVNGKLTMTGDLVVEDGAVLTLSNGADIEMGENALTLKDGSSLAVDAGNASAQTSKRSALGKYLVVDATSMAEALGSEWNRDAIAVDGATAGSTAWEGNQLYLYTRSDEVDAVLSSAWGVYKSSQAFTSTLRANKAQAVDMSAQAYDGKGGLLQIAPKNTLAWAAIYADDSRLSNQGHAAGANYTLYGAALGVEHRFEKGRSIGAAFGYDMGETDSLVYKNVDQESLHFAVYGRPVYRKVGKGAIAVDCAATVGTTSSELSGLPDWDQDNLQLDTRVSYIRNISERTAVSGFVGAQYYAQDSADVDGAELSSMQNMRLSVGAGASHRINNTTIFGEVALHNDVMRHNPKLNVESTSFHGCNPGRVGGSISAGATHRINTFWNVFGNYTIEAADNHVDNQINVGVSRSF
ncbi:MAG: autotransporter domain-containing protein [Akkermansia sp.]|nr:autotransporter domain-containing protein [Akkermansia sp.]